MDRNFMTTLPKLTGNNWYEWKREVETYFMLIGCGGHVGSTRPKDEKGLEWDLLDQKVYAIIWFLIDANHRSPIIATNSGKEAWTKIVAEYQKDSPTNRILLHRQFYSITHDPALPISQFIDDVSSIARKLDAIGHKLDDVVVSDKILIGLAPSWASVRTILMLQTKSLTIDEITSALKQYEANESPDQEGVKRESGESALYARGGGGGSKQRVKDTDDGFDWGNSKNREGVCWRCGRPRHIARFCVSDMPDDVKREILNRPASTDVAAVVENQDDSEDALFAFASAYTNPLLSDSDSTTTPITAVPKRKKNRRPKYCSKDSDI